MLSKAAPFGMAVAGLDGACVRLGEDRNGAG